MQCVRRGRLTLSRLDNACGYLMPPELASLIRAETCVTILRGAVVTR